MLCILIFASPAVANGELSVLLEAGAHARAHIYLTASFLHRASVCLFPALFIYICIGTGSILCNGSLSVLLLLME